MTWRRLMAALMLCCAVTNLVQGGYYGLWVHDYARGSWHLILAFFAMLTKAHYED